MNESFRILHLNDDCLRELFSLLPSIDLCAVKKTCQRFKTIADEVAKKRFKNTTYECHPNYGDYQEHETILEEFGESVSIMSLRHKPAIDVEAPSLLSNQLPLLLRHCKCLVGLYLIQVDLRYVAINEVFENLRLLKFVNCYDVKGGEHFATIVSACERLEVFACFGEILYHLSRTERVLVPTRLYRNSLTIKHVTTNTFSPENMRSFLPTADDMAKLYTLEFRTQSGRLALHIDFLAQTNPSLVNLVLNMPARTEDFQKIAKSLPIWTNLMSYDIITGFQLPDKIRELFPNLIQVGRANKECLVSPTGSMNQDPRCFYIYKWTRDTRLFEAGSDEELRFGEFQAWKKEMKEIGIHIDPIQLKK